VMNGWGTNMVILGMLGYKIWLHYTHTTL